MKRICRLGTGVLLLGCLCGCPPAPQPGAPEASPTITWRITVYAPNGTVEIPLNSGTASYSLSGQTEFVVGFEVDDPSGIGSLKVGGAKSNIVCFFYAGGRYNGRGGGPISATTDGGTHALQQTTESFSGTQVTTHQSVLFWFNQTGNDRVCPATVELNGKTYGPVTPESGSIIFNAEAADAANPSLTTSGVLTIHIDPNASP